MAKRLKSYGRLLVHGKMPCGYDDPVETSSGRIPYGLDTARQVYDCIRKNPGNTSAGIARILGMSPTGSLVPGYVAAMSDLGLMVWCETGPDGYTRWYADDDRLLEKHLRKERDAKG